MRKSILTVRVPTFTIMNTIVKILLFTILLLGCKGNEIKPSGMEIYLLENPENLKRCEDFDVTNQNILSNALILDSDILSYNWKDHNITLKESAYDKLKDSREKNNFIYPIIITLNREKIYGVWYKYSILSMSCKSTLITENDFGPTNGKMEYSIVHGQGFGASTLGKDPRGDKRIYDYLKSTGRLVE